MALAKTELFDSTLRENAKLFRALGHPARLAIIRFLANMKSCYTGDLSQEIPLSRTTVNQHLSELKNTGIIQGHITGITTHYCLKPEAIQKLAAALGEMTDMIRQIAGFKC